MTLASPRPESVLARFDDAVPNLEGANADDLKRAVRFWYGTTAGNAMRKAECVRALQQVFQDRPRLEQGLRALTDAQRTLLGVVRRYGGAISGQLLHCEALARGLVEKRDNRPVYERTAVDPVFDLYAKTVLVSAHGGMTGRHYGSYFYSGYDRSYPDLILPAGLRDLVRPAPALPWPRSRPTEPPVATIARPAAAVAMDLWGVAQALAQTGSWKTNRGGTPGKSLQTRLSKLVAAGTAPETIVTPAPECLYYELLRGWGAITVQESEGRIDLGVVRQHLLEPAARQARAWVRSWLFMPLWQDGIGAVPDRDRDTNPERIRPDSIRRARELLACALTRVAQGDPAWLDLEAFLEAFWAATTEAGHSIYWTGYVWHPDFVAGRGKEHIAESAPRRFAYWLGAEGTWAANALLGTLVQLGLVEHGVAGAHGRHRFRLTGLGRTVFGAPDVTTPEPAYEPKFLTVQPNHDVVANLSAADPRSVWPLAHMARRTSGAGETVQTFVLTRESVYQALESGLTPEAIRRFLTDHSTTGLPAVVSQSLTDWSRKREALVFRSDVAVGIGPPGKESPFAGRPSARPLGDGVVLIPAAAGTGLRGCAVLDHHRFPLPAWQVDEDGRVRVTDAADAVCLARLSQFADPEGPGWVITATSVRRARERGIPAEQVLGWLTDHLSGALPPVIETAIRNWSTPARVFLGELLMLQVSQPRAYAMIQENPRFRPLLLGSIPPDWFVVRAESRPELERLLRELGFTVEAVWKVSAGTDTSTTADAEPAARRQRTTRNRRRGDGQ